MQPVWVRTKAVALWRANVGAGRVANDAMMVWDEVDLRLPVEVWMLICEWLLATQSMVVLEKRVRIMAQRHHTMCWWTETAEAHLERVNDVFLSEEANDMYFDAYAQASMRARTLRSDFKFHWAKTLIHAQRLGMSECLRDLGLDVPEE